MTKDVPVESEMRVRLNFSIPQKLESIAITAVRLKIEQNQLVRVPE
jgi:hypothetical protein